VVTRRPSSRPAAASTNAPVQALAIVAPRHGVLQLPHHDGGALF
jgi:hypothetical protein